MPQSVQDTVANLFTTCRDTVYASVTGADGESVLVSLGDPGQYQPATIVAVGMDVRLPIARPTAGTGRSREITAEIDVIISVYVPGGAEAQALAIGAALTLQGLLETHLRTSPNETLSGACRDAWVSAAQVRNSVAYSRQDDPAVPAVATGRVSDNTVTVTAAIRY